MIEMEANFEDPNYWNSSTVIGGGEQYYIEGLNIWEHKWINTHQYFVKKESVRQVNLKIPIYEIKTEGKSTMFGATEVSNGAYIICTHYE
jgi:hypothetical protein